MLVDWSSTSGFVEVKSRTLLTWSFMFARMANGSLYFFEDESEKKPLFVVQFSDSFSAETIQGNDSRPYQFEIGNVYEINNQMKHSVVNKGESSRVNFIFDYVPPEKINRQ